MKVVFDFRAKHIAIDGDGAELVEMLKLVREIAPKLSQIKISAVGEDEPGIGHNGAEPSATISGPAVGAASAGAPTMRAFAKALSVANASEKIAAIAYYAKRHEGRESFAPREMGEWFAMCGFQKPSQMPVALSDAKRKYGYIDSTERGQWKLTISGENLIIGKLEEGAAG